MVAMASPFVRLNDDRAEETAIQQSGVAAAASIAAAVAQSQAEWEARRAGVLRVSGALIASILPLAIAYACGKLMPGAVSDAMAKSALASSTMMLCSFVGYGVSVPVRVLVIVPPLRHCLFVYGRTGALRTQKKHKDPTRTT